LSQIWKRTPTEISSKKAARNFKKDKIFSYPTVTEDKVLEEARKPLEVGFEYVTDMDGKKLFRKRK